MGINTAGETKLVSSGHVRGFGLFPPSHLEKEMHSREQLKLKNNNPNVQQ